VGSQLLSGQGERRTAAYNHALGAGGTPQPVGLDAAFEHGNDARAVTTTVEAPEVDGLLGSLTIALEVLPLSTPSSVVDGAAVLLGRSVLNTIELLSFAPNFSIGISTIAPFTHAIVSSGLLERHWFVKLASSHRITKQGRVGMFTSDSNHELRTSLVVRHEMFLLASRLHRLVGGDMPHLQQLLWALMELRLEDFKPQQEGGDHTDPALSKASHQNQLGLLYRECRRLRGLALNTLLNEAMPAAATLSTFGTQGNNSEPSDAVLALLHLLSANATLRTSTWRDLVRLPQSSQGHASSSSSTVVQLDDGELGIMSVLARQIVARREAHSRLELNLFSPSRDVRNVAGENWMQLMETDIPAAMREALSHPAAPLIEEDLCITSLLRVIADASSSNE
jgi:hypothetical protein